MEYIHIGVLGEQCFHLLAACKDCFVFFVELLCRGELCRAAFSFFYPYNGILGQVVGKGDFFGEGLC